MIPIGSVSQGSFIYPSQKQSTAKNSDFSTLLQQKTKFQKNHRDSAEIKKQMGTKALSDKYDVHNLDDSEREALLTELKQEGKIDSDFHYGFILLPVTLDELRSDPQCMVEFVSGKSPLWDCKDMLSFSKQIADYQLALYQKLKSEGKEMPKLKEQAEQYGKLASILQELERK